MQPCNPLPLKIKSLIRVSTGVPVYISKAMACFLGAVYVLWQFFVIFATRRNED